MTKKFAELKLNNIKEIIKNGKEKDIAMPFNTNINGIHYVVTIEYTKGGGNPITMEYVPRGYYLGVIGGTIDPNGNGEYNLLHGGRIPVLKVSRKSKKREEYAHAHWGEPFNKMLNYLH